jgi:putative hemolysin
MVEIGRRYRIAKGYISSFQQQNVIKKPTSCKTRGGKNCYEKEK